MVLHKRNFGSFSINFVKLTDNILYFYSSKKLVDMSTLLNEK